MKLTLEESDFITQIVQQESTAQFDLTLSKPEAAQLKQWLSTLSKASDVQLLAKINSQLMYFPAHIDAQSDGDLTVSCELPSIVDINNHYRHWRTKELEHTQLRSSHLPCPFKVLSLSLSGLVVRTFPYKAHSVIDQFTDVTVNLTLAQQNNVRFDVTLGRIINDTTIALEIMNIHDGYAHLKQAIFESYNQQ
ncbi:hypothetical protein CWB96_04910 [Pseudoalteromonas citrea]|uniref:PilZ domain-containing protein n=1 Tax=Pseudoalteromonas citrea TaxID=43655 RepID=A0A5S3XV64_9GAMM|nr:hypothetical protein [Pseudoalteromonas citrea]TMP44717.1 hypothetical protein CWB97_05775 [Pseudoalteromonas citrea]TMP61091.1 hypothetical protein CWB96_04910 [Pseudoalteromonas citrea]